MISVPEAGTLPRIAASDRRLERLDDLGREPVGIQRERLVEPDPHHLPVPGGGVLAGRHARWRGRAPEPGRRRGATPSIVGEVPEPERLRGSARAARRPARAVLAEGVGAVVAVRRRHRARRRRPTSRRRRRSTRGTEALDSSPITASACSRCRGAPRDALRVGRGRSACRTARTGRTCRHRSVRALDRRPSGSSAGSPRRRSVESAPGCCANGRRSRRRRRSDTSSLSGSAPCSWISWRTSAR